MAYVNPLHPPISAPYRSQYSSLGNAIFSPNSQPQFQSPTRRRLPQQPYTPSSKWRTATGRLNQIHSLIPFDYVNYTKQGVSMLELTTRSMHAIEIMLHGANDQVFAGTGLVRITLRILVRCCFFFLAQLFGRMELSACVFVQWPGYEDVDWARSIEVNANGPMTRAQLAVAVAKNFSYFLEVGLTYVLVNLTLSWTYLWQKARSEAGRPSEWHLATSGIRFQHLFLVALCNVFEDVWQADVAVDLRWFDVHFRFSSTRYWLVHLLIRILWHVLIYTFFVLVTVHTFCSNSYLILFTVFLSIKFFPYRYLSGEFMSIVSLPTMMPEGDVDIESVCRARRTYDIYHLVGAHKVNEIDKIPNSF